MAVALNYPTQLCPKEWLFLQDDEIRTKFAGKPPSSGNGATYDKLLVRPRIESDADPNASYDDDDTAENFFYGRFVFERSPHQVRVVPTVQASFLRWSNERLHPPQYTPDEMGVSQTHVSDPTFIASCAANYLLKNFWHNYVHNFMQRISFETYKRFGGEARYEADFEADNLATLFLIHSYGLPVRALGIESNDVREKIIHLFRRNRCNRVFALRAEALHEDLSQEEREWRYRRTLGIYLSGWTAALGFAVTSLGVYLRSTHVIVSLNGIRLAVDTKPYFGADSGQRHRHFYEVAVTAGMAYTNIILDEQNSHPALHASQSLLACFTRAGLELTEEVMLPPSERPAEIRIQSVG
jgi:hypothetical protein